MPVLKTNCQWKVVIYKVLQSVAASLLVLIKCKFIENKIFLKLMVRIWLKHSYIIKYDI
jgi:hypothetical protein